MATGSPRITSPGAERSALTIWLRRLVTMVPAFAVIAIGVNPTRALVISQVVLSIALPIPMIALLHFTSSRRIMGEFANRRATVIAAASSLVHRRLPADAGAELTGRRS